MRRSNKQNIPSRGATWLFTPGSHWVSVSSHQWRAMFHCGGEGIYFLQYHHKTDSNVKIFDLLMYTCRVFNPCQRASSRLRQGVLFIGVSLGVVVVATIAKELYSVADRPAMIRARMRAWVLAACAVDISLEFCLEYFKDKLVMLRRLFSSLDNKTIYYMIVIQRSKRQDWRCLLPFPIIPHISNRAIRWWQRPNWFLRIQEFVRDSEYSVFCVNWSMKVSFTMIIICLWVPSAWAVLVGIIQLNLAMAQGNRSRASLLCQVYQKLSERFDRRI
jgi:hypothetical protein